MEKAGNFYSIAVAQIEHAAAGDAAGGGVGARDGEEGTGQKGGGVLLQVRSRVKISMDKVMNGY